MVISTKERSSLPIVDLNGPKEQTGTYRVVLASRGVSMVKYNGGISYQNLELLYERRIVKGIEHFVASALKANWFNVIVEFLKLVVG